MAYANRIIKINGTENLLFFYIDSVFSSTLGLRRVRQKKNNNNNNNKCFEKYIFRSCGTTARTLSTGPW